MDSRYYQKLAEDIVNLDSGILSAHLTSNPAGSVLGEYLRSEYRKEIGTAPDRADGMIPKWVVSIFNTLRRMDSFRSKTRYVIVGRDRYIGIFFLLASNEDVLIAMTLEKNKRAPVEIYEMVNRYVNGLIK